MKKILFILTSLLILVSCIDEKRKNKKKSEFEVKRELFADKLKLNKKKYIIKKGEKLKIYYTENSCCPFCSPRLRELKSVKFLFHKSETFSNDCEGCTDLYSLNFKGISKGVDTVYMTTLTPREDCETYKEFKENEKYIIIVE